MTATTHALVGAAIVSRFPNPAGLVLAALSHFPLDYLPHWDVIDKKEKHSLVVNLALTAFDVLLGFGLVWYLFSQTVSAPILLAGVFSGQLPDWLSAPYFFFNINLFSSKTIREIQVKYHHKTGLPLGLLTQIGVILLLFLLLGVIPLP